MIPIYRKLRKKMADDNKPIKYARYAIGEILLVVIGILIALQINNWNEGRKQQNEINGALTQILNDLKQDKEILDHIIVKAGEEYNAGWFHNLFFGKHWRDVWKIPVKIKISKCRGS